MITCVSTIDTGVDLKRKMFIEKDRKKHDIFSEAFI